jgi:ribonuclease Z
VYAFSLQLTKLAKIIVNTNNFMKSDFSVRILGRSSAIPTQHSFPSSQFITHYNTGFLVDCGEACQIQIRRNGISMNHIRHIFISHLHGDHYFGLFGLLSSMNLLGRKRALHIYAHPKLEHILRFIFVQNGDGIKFPLIFHALSHENKQLILETKRLNVYAFPLRHRIPTCGFLFLEKPKMRNIRPDAIEKYELNHLEIRRAKMGKDLFRDGEKLAENVELCYPQEACFSYAYCSDTSYDSKTAEYVKNVDLMYHEATFAKDMLHKEEAKYHSTAGEAARVASEANAKNLIIGHFSTRYQSIQPLLDEARAIFPNTVAAQENFLYDVSTGLKME